MRLSLVTCTRNPETTRLARVLGAIAALRVPAGWERDHLIVDSASDSPVAAMPVVKEFIAGRSWAHVHRTELPGLAAARRAALLHVSGDPIVWVDDDNVLEGGYLEAVARIAGSLPEVGAWGAGVIEVEFPDGAPGWVASTQRATFQARSTATDEFGRDDRWREFFPVGSGLVTRRAVMDRWVAESLAGRASLTGRRGASLSSGDDAQIILGAVAGGAQVGVVAAQRLTHLIPRSRTSLRYLMRLEFALAESVRVARAECFPASGDAREPIEDIAAVATARRVARSVRSSGPRAGLLNAARSLGAACGVLRTHDRPEPAWLRAAVTALRLR